MDIIAFDLMTALIILFAVSTIRRGFITTFENFFFAGIATLVFILLQLVFIEYVIPTLGG